MPNENIRWRTPVRLNAEHPGNEAMRAHQEALINQNLSAPPDTFDEEKTYRVQMKWAVLLPGTDIHLRPMDFVEVSGKVANEHKDAIAAAREV